MCDIMIVDDDKLIHRSLDLILKETKICGERCDIAHAYSAEEAIKLVKDLDHRPFIFFIDINLPLKSGPDFVEWLHENQILALMFIITGSTLTKKDFEKLITAGVDGYFRKPIKNELLQTIVGMTLTKANKLSKKHAKLFRQNAPANFDNTMIDNILEKTKHLNSLYEEFNHNRMEA